MLIKIINRIMFVFGTLEKIIYQKKKPRFTELNLMGYVKLKSTFKKFSTLDPDFVISKNKFIDRYVYSKEHLNLISSEVLNNQEIRKVLFETFGMNFSVDYIFGSKIYSIPKNLQNSIFYANHFHRDKLFTPNMVKIFVALEDISTSQGPTEFYTKKDSVSLSKNLKNEKFTKHSLTGKLGAASILQPTQIFHRAGIPKMKNSRKQLMLQLNPSREWSVAEDLYEKQFFYEQNFPFLCNIWKRHAID